MKQTKPITIPRFQVDHSYTYVEQAVIGVGMTLYVCWNRYVGSPLGFVWGWSHSESFDVMGSYVLPEVRRQGVRTKINEHIFKSVPVIKTWAGTKSGGFAFLKASGYRFNREARQWCKSRGKKK